MRDDSSIDPAGTRQPQAPYASGPAQPQTPQAQQPATGPDITAPAGTGPAGTGPATGTETAIGTETAAGTNTAAGFEPARAGTDVPVTQTQAETTAATAQGQPAATPEQAIWDTAKADEFRHRWHDVQTHFVEDPRGSVTEARQLVDEAVQSLADSVHDREEQLEHSGARASDSTEGMRDTVLQYHHLLDRLLTV